ncbi:hypothetical protein [Pseudovibrio exalbescens]|uniref:hypothetical protein n=1 Tax=Pseudovibrio exalbescens TaxID=197461 RepID=UPI000C9CC730|nr:hypothetical protein [Pseudovibrio exalbescens]
MWRIGSFAGFRGLGAGQASVRLGGFRAHDQQFGFAVAQRKKAGLDAPDYLLSHIPLGWAHIILSDEYRRRQMTTETP